MPRLAGWRDRTQTGAMSGTLLFFLLTGAVVAIWLDALALRELASRHSRRQCEQAGLQWLDQNVVLDRLELKRVDGRLALLRRYRFEVSVDGADRHCGSIWMHGKQVVGASMPSSDMSATPPAIPIPPI